jgi:alanyl-tRNA synthetase
MAVQLFYEDPNLFEFDATVVARVERDGRQAVTLDRTAFYPEGGGQPCDLGELSGVSVVAVRKVDGEIHHVLDGDSASLAPGTSVRGKVDPGRRRNYRQQHTGQHILSAALMRVGRYETVSVHQGEEYTTIEIDAASITPEDVDATERLANEAIEADLPVTAVWATDETIARFPLRRPPKVAGSIRVVQVGELDCVACGGVHVTRTGEIRLVRAIAVETIRGRVRTAWKIGDRAFDHYRLCSDVVGRLGASLSAQPHELVDRVAAQDERIRGLDIRLRRLSERVHTLVAEQLLAEADGTDGQPVVVASFTDEPPEFLRGVTENLLRQPAAAVCLVNRAEDRVQWSVGIGPDSPLAFDGIRAKALPLIGGKGGGRPPIWQGVGTSVEGVDGFLEAFRRLARSGS